MKDTDKDVLVHSIKALRQLSDKVAQYERREHAAVAIIGMACRLPGAVHTPDELWRALRSGQSAIAQIGPERWDHSLFYDPDYDAPGKVVSRYAGLLQNIYEFEPEFFAVSGIEARSLDPQQRLLLEGSWLALEDAGLNALHLRGSNTGVFVGIGSNDHGIALMSDSRAIDAYVASGNSVSMAAGRLSWFYDFTGPSMAIDTACSSSLVAVHEACQKLRQGDCPLALVAGVNAILTPHASVNFSRARMLTPERECHVFDARARGYIRGEGCVVIVLKLLAEAHRDRDPIYAVIEGSAVNHDGHTSGLTVPSGTAQESVIRAALARANITTQQVRYVEAHGTGTSLGDPVEANALARVFGPGRAPGQPLFVGSIKANFGHLEAAAGLAGLIKTALLLQHREIPPQVGFDNLNPRINWDPRCFTVPTQAHPLENEPLHAGISSFGFSGTNAHVVLGTAPAPETPSDEGLPQEQVIALSARSLPALRAQVAAVADYLDSTSQGSMLAHSYTSTVRRATFRERIAVVALTAQDAAARLRAAVDNHRSTVSPRKVALLLTADDDFGATRRVLHSVALNGNSSPGALSDVHRELIGWFTRVGMAPDYLVLVGIDPARLESAGGAEIPVGEYFLNDPQRAFVVAADNRIARPLETVTLGDDVLLMVLPGAAVPPPGLQPIVLTGRVSLLGALATAFIEGHDIHWQHIYPSAQRGSPGWPGYCFQRRPLRSERIDSFLRVRQVPAAAHPLLTQRKSEPEGIVAYPLDLSVPMLDFLKQHRVRGARIVPASLLLDLLRAAARDATGTEMPSLAAVTFHHPVDCDQIGRTYSLRVNTRATPAEVGLWSHGDSGHASAPLLCHVSARVGRDSTVRPGSIAKPSMGENVDIAGLYIQHENNGVSLGPVFRCVTRLQRDHETVTGEVRLDAGLHSNVVMRDTIVLDGCLQATAALRSDPAQMMLLAAIELVTFERELPLHSHVRVDRRPDGAEPASAGTLHVDIDVTDDDVQRICHLRGAMFKSAEEPSRREALASCLYSQRWVAQPRDADMTPASSPADLQSGTLVADLQDLAGQHRLQDYDAYRADIEQHCQAIIGTTLESMGYSAEAFRAPLVDAELQQMGIVPRQQRLFRHMVSVRHRNPRCAAADLGAIERKYPQYHAETDFIQRCGRALTGVLRGSEDPLSLLFGDAALTGTDSIYLSSPISRVLNEYIARKVGQLSRESLRPLRILEIGAGTGGTTRSVLANLPARHVAVYCFTDVSQSFLTRARSLFAAQPFLSYRLLDIEKPPAEQGFETHSFDIIIAANVLHATRSLEETVKHVRELIAPGGELIVRECIRPQLSADLSFGMTEGWWRFADTALRQQYPLLGPGQWQELLRASGFRKSQPLLPTADCAEAVILAQAPGETARGRWLVAHSGQEAARALIQCLSQHGHSALEMNLDTEYPQSLTEHLRGSLQTHVEQGCEHIVCFPLRRVTAIGTANPAEQAAELYERMIVFCQQCLRAPKLQSAKLWCVTLAAEKVLATDAVQGLANSVMTGVMKTVALEYPGRIGGVIDLESDEALQTEPLLREMAYTGRHRYLALRAGEIYHPRLQRLSTPVPSPLSDRDHFRGHVLITGGLGGIGFAIARKLSRYQGITLILASRSPGDPGKRARLEQLRLAGADVYCCALDVSDPVQVRNLFRERACNGRAITHIVHAAGVGGDVAFNDITLGQHRDITDAKIHGTWNLSRYCDPASTRVFIVLSTMVALWGAKHKTHYVLANHFADRLVQQRRSQGLPGVSVQLGPVAAGMLSEEGRAMTHSLGVTTLDVDEVVEQILQPHLGEHGEVALLDIDWPRFVPHYEHSWLGTLFDACGAENATAGATPAQPAMQAAGHDLRRYHNLPTPARERFLQQLVLEVLQAVMAIDSSGHDVLNTGFHDLGMDSLLTLSFAKALARRTELPISTINIFDAANVVNLTRWLAEQLESQRSSADSGPTESATGEWPEQLQAIRKLPRSVSA